MRETHAAFTLGQIVHHRLFDYRGVIVDVDSEFQGSEEWYSQVARSHPPKDRPWYHVLVHNGDHETYVSERNLEPDPSSEPVIHPLVHQYFDDFLDGTYVARRRTN